MVGCTVQQVNCAPQRRLRRDGELDLKETHGPDVNTVTNNTDPIALKHTKTGTITPLRLG